MKAGQTDVTPSMSTIGVVSVIFIPVVTFISVISVVVVG